MYILSDYSAEQYIYQTIFLFFILGLVFNLSAYDFNVKLLNEKMKKKKKKKKKQKKSIIYDTTDFMFDHQQLLEFSFH